MEKQATLDAFFAKLTLECVQWVLESNATSRETAKMSWAPGYNQRIRIAVASLLRETSIPRHGRMGETLGLALEENMKRHHPVTRCQKQKMQWFRENGVGNPSWCLEVPWEDGPVTAQQLHNLMHGREMSSGKAATLHFGAHLIQ